MKLKEKLFFETVANMYSSPIFMFNYIFIYFKTLNIRLGFDNEQVCQNICFPLLEKVAHMQFVKESDSPWRLPQPEGV